MNIIPARRVLCSECFRLVEHAIELEFRDRSVWLCLDHCVDELRNKLPRRRTVRPLSPKMRRVLAWIAQTPAQCGSLATISAATGGYSYNALRSLLARGLVEQHGGDAESLRGAVFELTSAGLEAVAE